MKISVRWLNDFVALDESPEQIAAVLAMLGHPVDSIEKSGAGAVLDVDITANRPDCLNHLGIARELAAWFRQELHRPETDPGDLATGETLPASISIEAPDLCYRYCGLVVKGVRIAPSPGWLQERLVAVGQRPINNVVDITNYVLQEIGHPLHAFDYRKLRGGAINVRTARSGESICTLDGRLRSLDPSMLVIADAELPVAIAGVMGGADSEVDEQTRDLLLESAWFYPASIRKTSRALGLSTEASYRYERGADAGIPPYALLRVLGLILRLAGGQAASPLIDVFPRPQNPVPVPLCPRQIQRLTGAVIPDRFVEDVLPRLEIGLGRQPSGGWLATPPSHRVDLKQEADLIEEAARFFGYNRIPSTLPQFSGNPVQRFLVKERESSRDYFCANGFQEILSSSFTDGNRNDLFLHQSTGEKIRLDNPLDDEEPFLRTTLLAGLVKALKINENNFNHDLRLFEMSKVYGNRAGEPEEKVMLAFGATGQYLPGGWAVPSIPWSVFLIKGLLDGWLRRLGTAEYRWLPAEDVSFLQPGSALMLEVAGRPAGVAGQLQEQLAGKMKFRQKTFAGEFQLDALAGASACPFVYSPLPRFPFADRDVSFTVDNRVTFGKMMQVVESLKIAELHQVKLLDLYNGKDVPEGQTALTVRLVFLHPERTMTDAEVDGLRDRITEKWLKAYQIRFR